MSEIVYGSAKARKAVGFIICLVFAGSAHMDGYSFYEGNPTIVWALGIVGLALLISGIAKDVVAIAKQVVK